MSRDMLLGKVVKIDPGVLSILCPDFVWVQQITPAYADKSVIYAGAPTRDIELILRMGTRRWINTVGYPEVDLMSRQSLLEYVYGLHNKTIPKHVSVAVSNLDDDEFLYCIKVILTLGVWPYTTQNQQTTFFDFYKALTTGVSESLAVLNSLLSIYPPLVVESALFSCISKAKHLPNHSQVSSGYKQVLYEIRTSRWVSFQRALRMYGLSNHLSTQSKLLRFVLEVFK